MVAAGIAMSTVGFAAIPLGAWVIAAAHGGPRNDLYCNPVNPACTAVQPNYTTVDRVGALIIGSGVSLAAGGLLMTVLGAQKHRVRLEGGPLGSTGVSLHVSF